MMARRWAVALLGSLVLASVLLAQIGRSMPDILYDAYVQSASGWTAALHSTTASALTNTGDLAKAAAHWEAALREEPQNLSLARQLAETHMQLKNWDAARAALERVADLAQGDGWARLHLGLLTAPLDARQALGWLDAAEARGIAIPAPLHDALENATTTSLALVTGAALAESGYYPQAEHAFMLAAEGNFLKADALASVGLMRGLQGLDGLPWLEAAALEDPDSAQVWLVRGLYFRAQNRLFESLDSLVAALNIDPLNPELNAQIAQAYSLLGNTGSAAFWWNQAASLSRQDPRYVEPYQTAVAENNLSATLPAP
jgi:tetratricopeptide (TPR) repeat protein